MVPRQKTPELSVPTLSGSDFNLSEEQSERGVVICFYRGLHCPICANYLKELEKQTPVFAERGVTTIAISSDGRERTEEMAEKIDAKSLRFGYDLSLSKARKWGLYVSTSRGKTSIGIEEPALFSELVGALDFAIEKNYPARGEYAGEV
ncbi:MAG: AhpC/TSA family protein [Hyphomicrobiales bacterium]|nr:AhpC/TSA family protein [Hyphomicrobiales bacterium]